MKSYRIYKDDEYIIFEYESAILPYVSKRKIQTFIRQANILVLKKYGDKALQIDVNLIEDFLIIRYTF